MGFGVDNNYKNEIFMIKLGWALVSVVIECTVIAGFSENNVISSNSRKWLLYLKADIEEGLISYFNMAMYCI